MPSREGLLRKNPRRSVWAYEQLRQLSGAYRDAYGCGNKNNAKPIVCQIFYDKK